jgi:flagellar motor protein MotB
MKKKAEHEESGEKVPPWIVSFADMITLLMSFFVMLQTMAADQDATLLGASRESFRRAIAGFGMPDLFFGKDPGSGHDYRKLKYPMEEANEEVKNKSRVIDAEDDRIRQLFGEICKEMEVGTSNPSRENISPIVAPIRFKPGESTLDEAERRTLQNLAGTLASELAPGQCRIDVVARCLEPAPSQKQWSLSARRAHNVATALKEALESGGRHGWEVFSWGCGSGRQDLWPEGAASRDSAVWIGVTRMRENNGR